MYLPETVLHEPYAITFDATIIASYATSGERGRAWRTLRAHMAHDARNSRNVVYELSDLDRLGQLNVTR